MRRGVLPWTKFRFSEIREAAQQVRLRRSKIQFNELDSASQSDETVCAAQVVTAFFQGSTARRRVRLLSSCGASVADT